MTEHTTQNAIIRWCAMHGHMRIFRQNTGVHREGNRVIRYGIPGQGDLRCIVAPTGRLWEIEVKAATGRQSAAQHNYETMLRSMGAVYTLARCVEDVWEDARRHFPQHEWATPAEVVE